MVLRTAGRPTCLCCRRSHRERERLAPLGVGCFWDVELHPGGHPGFVPSWYPPLCLGFDVVVGGVLVGRFRGLPTPPLSPRPRHPSALPLHTGCLRPSIWHPRARRAAFSLDAAAPPLPGARGGCHYIASRPRQQFRRTYSASTDARVRLDLPPRTGCAAPTAHWGVSRASSGFHSTTKAAAHSLAAALSAL